MSIVIITTVHGHVWRQVGAGKTNLPPNMPLRQRNGKLHWGKNMQINDNSLLVRLGIGNAHDRTFFWPLLTGSLALQPVGMELITSFFFINCAEFTIL